MPSFNPTIYSSVSELHDLVRGFSAKLAFSPESRLSGIAGFDGFVDTFIRMQNPATMADFGPRVQAAAGVSASYTVHHIGDTFGGNGPLLASALHQILDKQIDISYIGALGRPNILPIFQEALGPRMKELHSIAEPAHSDCLEFRDGKIMLSDLHTCGEINWARLLEVVGQNKLDALLKEADFIAAVNWGKLNAVGTIWENLPLQLAKLGVPKKKVIFFMDLAEFEHRPTEDRQKLLATFPIITEQCQTILSFNLKEAWQMADSFDRKFHGRKSPKDVAELAAFLKSKIEVDRIIVHPNDGAACASQDVTVYLPGPFCASPLISTGAGDNFGAGCLAAALRELSEEEMLLAGSCASGYFVRSGRSATWAQIAHLAKQWLNHDLPDRIFDSTTS